MLGATRRRPGNVYFVTDGEPVVFREFVSDLLATQGVAPPSRSIPAWAASARDQLDYAPVKTIADGLAELRAA